MQMILEDLINLCRSNEIIQISSYEGYNYIITPSLKEYLSKDFMNLHISYLSSIQQGDTTGIYVEV